MLTIVDKPAMSLKDMGRAIEEAEQAWGEKVEFVAVDFLELVGGVPSLSDVSKVDQLARRVKDFSREHDVVTLLLHQVGRGAGGTGAEPLDIISGRYGSEISADYVLAGYRPCLRPGISQDDFLRERWQLWVQFLKTRGGSEIHASGLMHCFDPFTMRISYPYPTEPLFTDTSLGEEPW
jgi:hypothetical protein